MIKITGGSGFVGRYLSLYFQEHNIESSNISRPDLWSMEGFMNCKTVIHLAGKAHDLKKVSNPTEYYKVNYELTKKLYDLFLKSDAEKFVFVSSVKAVRDVAEAEITEELIPYPMTHYGKSKLMAEEYIQNQTLPKGKSYYILRPCMIHGPGNKGNLNVLYNFVKMGIPYPLAAFENKRSFLSIDNLCFILIKLLESNAPSGIYNLADDIPLSTTELVEMLGASLNKPVRLWKVPVKIVRLIASIGDKLKLPLNSEVLTKLTENYVVSNKKIKQDLAIQLPLTSREGLIKTTKSFSTP